MNEQAPPDSGRGNLREVYRSQLQRSLGGWSGTLVTAIPPVVFVAANAISGLRPAIVAAVGSAVVLAAYRAARRQPTQQVVSGLFGVLIAALIAARTGQARGYFLLGIWTSFLYAVPFAVSIVVRRPLVGWLWEFLDPTPGTRPWYRHPRLLRAYTLATLGGTVVFLARGVVQLTLYRHNDTGWLAVARIAMSYPLWIAAVAFGLYVGNRARRAVASAATEPTAAAVTADGPSAD
jgi:hypothetical protein